MSFKVFTLTFASGATGTNKVAVTPHSKISLVASAMTNWNAGAGNASMSIRGGLSATDTHADIPSCTVSTATVKGIYPMPYNAAPFISVGFGTAVTGSAANTIDVILYNEVGAT